MCVRACMESGTFWRQRGSYAGVRPSQVYRVLAKIMIVCLYLLA